MVFHLSKKKTILAKLGSGDVAITTLANPETKKNFAIALTNQGGGVIGAESEVQIGVDSNKTLTTPQIRIEFYSPQSVEVLIRKLNEVLSDIKE